ncbi:MAG: hypothetical protein MHM6MM_001092 [Cercozoa sp. M6MM]
MPCVSFEFGIRLQVSTLLGVAQRRLARFNAAKIDALFGVEDVAKALDLLQRMLQGRPEDAVPYVCATLFATPDATLPETFSLLPDAQELLQLDDEKLATLCVAHGVDAQLAETMVQTLGTEATCTFLLDSQLTSLLVKDATARSVAHVRVSPDHREVVVVLDTARRLAERQLQPDEELIDPDIREFGTSGTAGFGHLPELEDDPVPATTRLFLQALAQAEVGEDAFDGPRWFTVAINDMDDRD